MGKLTQFCQETGLTLFRDFRPTAFDSRGLGTDESNSHWIVAPCTVTRDSDGLSQSNFDACLELLGGESNLVQVHRFGHWGPGWFELIAVSPTPHNRAILADIVRALDNYPVLNEDDYSERFEHCAYCGREEAREDWDGLPDGYCRDCAEEHSEYQHCPVCGGWHEEHELSPYEDCNAYPVPPCARTAIVWFDVEGAPIAPTIENVEEDGLDWFYSMETVETNAKRNDIASVLWSGGSCRIVTTDGRVVEFSPVN
jgi:hypothetical protein